METEQATRVRPVAAQLRVAAQKRAAADPRGIGPLLTKSELAGILGCSVISIECRVRDGSIPPPLRIGKHVRWSTKVLEAWIDSGCPRSNRKTK